MSEFLSNCVVAIKTAHMGFGERERAESISDLFAWCGGGAISPNQLHAYLVRDAEKSTSRSNGLLLRSHSGRRYLLTLYHSLANAEATALAQQELIEPERDAPLQEDTSADAAASLSGLAEVVLAESAIPQDLRKGLYTAESYPHLDLSLIRLDGAGSDLCNALEDAGFVFATIDVIEDSPSREGSEIRVVGALSASKTKRTSEDQVVAYGTVKGLSAGLSFYWIDADLDYQFAGAPALEGEKIVGVFSPYQRNDATIASSFATIVKGGRIKTLVVASEQI